MSAENWQRPAAELSLLLAVFQQSLEAYLLELQQQGVRLAFIGDPAHLPERLTRLMQHAEQQTEGNSGLLLTVAMSYGGRQDLVEAAKKLAELASLGAIDPLEVRHVVLGSGAAVVGAHAVVEWAGYPCCGLLLLQHVPLRRALALALALDHGG